MLAYYGHEISPNQTETSEGYLICRNVPIARTGEQLYLAGELGIEGDPNRCVPVQRHAEDVFQPEAMASFEGKPVTDGHPPVSVGPENFGAYARGHLQNVRREGAFLVADFYINDPILAEEVKSRAKREVSCGYTCDYVREGPSFRQVNIRGNHAAVVLKGRAGREVAIKDSAPGAGKGKAMNKFVKNILTVFGRAAKDAAPEELGELVDTAATALEAGGQEPPLPPAPTVNDGLSQKLDQVIALLSAKAQDQEPEKPLTDVADLDKLADDLGGGKEDGKKEDGEKKAETKDVSCSPETRDAAIQIIRHVRPAVAAISDKKERAQVADALIEALREPDVMSGVLNAAQQSAKKVQDSRPDFAAVCAAQESAYAARNPHINHKEDK